MYFEEKKSNGGLLQGLRSLIFNTRVEIFIGLFAIGTFAGVLSFRENKKKASHRALAFSEIEAVQEAAAKNGRAVSPLTMEYAITNDVYMKVGEASNDALAVDETDVRFAKELEKHEDKSIATHATIHEYAEQMPKITSDIMQTLEKPINAANEMPALVNAFNRAWDYTHIDHYHTVYYPVTTCSGSGKSRHCSTTIRSRRIYDNTTHTFSFYRAEAEQAARMLEAFVAKYPDLNLSARLEVASETHGDNDKAILKSMAELFKKKKPTAEDILKLANTWATASNFSNYYPDAKDAYRRLTKLSPAWSNAVRNSETIVFTNRTRVERGPEGYRIAKAAMEYGMSLNKNMKPIVDGILFAGKKIPELDSTIREYIDVVLHGKKGNAGELREKIMSMAPEIYQSNFKNGFDVYPFKWGMVVLLTLVGAAIGAGVGVVVDKQLDNYAARRRAAGDSNFGL